MLVHVLGNSTNMTELTKILKRKKIFLIEDTCESLGAKYKNKYLGTYGHFSTFSFYSSHQISSGEGGAIACQSKDDYEIIKSLRSHGWSRGLKKEKSIARKYKNLDKRFIFYNSGFNLRPTDISASIGLSQLHDLHKLNNLRTINRNNLIRIFKKNKKIKNNFIFIEKNKFVKPSWFGIPILIKDKKKRNKFIFNIEKKGIETRPIISGNFLKQPAVKKYKINQIGNFKNSDLVNNSGFFLGLPTKIINKKTLKKIVKVFEENL